MKIYNIIILDESGSMQAMYETTILGCNEVLQTIRHAAQSDPEVEHRVQLVSFNSIGIKQRIPLAKVTEIPLLTHKDYQPDGTTPLYDAIGSTVNALLKYLDNQNDAESPVHCTIITDGMENASREFGQSAIRALIEQLRGRGWDFVFIGANFDVEREAYAMNIGSTIQYVANRQGTKDMFAREKEQRMRYYAQKKKDPKAPMQDFNIRLDEDTP
jgi:hypothetical protein